MPQAEADLEAIREYYERVAPDYAQTFVDGAIEKTLELEAFPRIGRVVPEIGDEDLRELVYRQYRIIYIVDAEGERADVLTIFHSAKQFGTGDFAVEQSGCIVSRVSTRGEDLLPWPWSGETVAV